MGLFERLLYAVSGLLDTPGKCEIIKVLEGGSYIGRNRLLLLSFNKELVS